MFLEPSLYNKQLNATPYFCNTDYQKIEFRQHDQHNSDIFFF